MPRQEERWGRPPAYTETMREPDTDMAGKPDALMAGKPDALMAGKPVDTAFQKQYNRLSAEIAFY